MNHYRDTSIFLVFSLLFHASFIYLYPFQAPVSLLKKDEMRVVFKIKESELDKVRPIEKEIRLKKLDRVVDKMDIGLHPTKTFEKTQVVRSGAVDFIPARPVERSGVEDLKNLPQVHNSETSPVRVTERTQVATLETSSLEVKATGRRDTFERAQVIRHGAVDFIQVRPVERSGVEDLKNLPQVHNSETSPVRVTERIHVATLETSSIEAKGSGRRDTFERAQVVRSDAVDFIPQGYDLQAKTDVRWSSEGDSPVQIGTMEDSERARFRFKAMVLVRIEKAKVYPAIARKMGMEGDVFACFTILPDGKVENIEVLPTTSCHELLKSAAVTTIEKAAPYLPVPLISRRDEGLRFEVKIVYKLN
ncbi:MAG: TonB family protein [Nitrospinae bacterium]|nr:TonB family protein [Nitrospinota bacterium]